MSDFSNRDPQAALRALANRWALLARDYGNEAKAKPQGDARGEYLRGLAEGYYKAALDLAALVKQGVTDPAGASAEPAAPASDASPTAAANYTAMALREVIDMLDFAGISPRDVFQNKDNSFRAVFSRWQPFSDVERLAKIRALDARVVVLENGKTKDTGDPYVDFAFRSS